jgi:NADH-quinone oxidoreductase subunit K
VFFYLIFCIALKGIFAFRKHLINVLIAIELLLLSCSCFFIFFGLSLKDLIGQIFSLYIITIAAAESSIALALLTIYYRLSGHLTVDLINLLKG